MAAEYEALTGIAGANFTIDPKQIFTPGEGNTVTVEEIERPAPKDKDGKAIIGPDKGGYLAQGMVRKVVNKPK